MSGNASQFDEQLVETSVLEGRIARSRTVPEFTMQAISQETGIPDDTLRSWERRYGFPAPSRDDSNRRVYSERDVVAVAWLRDQTRRGQGISEAIGMLRRILSQGPRGDTATRAPSPPLTPVSTLTDALLAGDLATAQAAWDRLAVSVSPDGLLEHVLLPAHARVGAGLLQLPDRLRAGTFLLRKAIRLFDDASPDRGDRDVAILSQGGTHAAVPAYALGATLASDGFRIVTAILELADATTLAAVRDLQRVTPVVVVAGRPDAALLDALAGFVDRDDIHLWWPTPTAGHDDDRWLPATLGETRDRLGNRA